MCVFEKNKKSERVLWFLGDMRVVARANWTCMKDFFWRGKCGGGGEWKGKGVICGTGKKQ